jgi:hypothetical protein
MKRILVLTIGIVLIGAVTAKAADDGWIRGVVTPYSASINKIDIYLIAPTYPGGVLQAIEGTWSVTEAGASFWLGGNGNTWSGKTANGYFTGYYPTGTQSYVNMDTINTSANWLKTGTLPDITSFTGSWNTTTDYLKLSPVDSTPGGDPNNPDTGYGFDNTRLAAFYITHGSWVQFSGQFGFTNSLGEPETITGSFLVPEPGTLVLLLGLAVSALAARRVWRRR